LSFGKLEKFVCLRRLSALSIDYQSTAEHNKINLNDRPAGPTKVRSREKVWRKSRKHFSPAARQLSIDSNKNKKLRDQISCRRLVLMCLGLFRRDRFFVNSPRHRQADLDP
jgi:hypothetical protein